MKRRIYYKPYTSKGIRTVPVLGNVKDLIENLGFSDPQLIKGTNRIIAVARGGFYEIGDLVDPNCRGDLDERIYI